MEEDIPCTVAKDTMDPNQVVQEQVPTTENVDGAISNGSGPLPFVYTGNILERLKHKLLGSGETDKLLDAEEYSAINAVLTGVDYAVHVLNSNKCIRSEANIWNYTLTVVNPSANQPVISFLDTSFMEVLFDQQKISTDPKDNYSTIWTLTPVGPVPASKIIPFPKVTSCGPPVGLGPYMIGNYITPGACLQLQRRSGEIFIGPKSKDPIYIRPLVMGPASGQVTLFYFEESPEKADLWAIYMKADKGRVYLQPMPPSAKGGPVIANVKFPPRNNIVHGLETSNPYMAHYVWSFNEEIKPKVQRPIQ